MISQESGFTADHTEFIDIWLNKLSWALQLIDSKSISDAVNILLSALENNADIYIIGNGGSASTASHMQNDFNLSTGLCAGRRFRVICLADNISTITAIANDYSYDDIFERQLKDRICPGDVLIALSGSGNSKNIIKAAEYAKRSGVTIIAMTGFDGGELFKIADCNLHIPINSMQIAECCHLIFNHIITCVIQCCCGRNYDLRGDMCDIR